ncbi:hypothetical protein D3C84_638850 [compost metagenome]
MPSRASVLVLGCVIDEITFAEAARRCRSRGQRLGHENGDSSLMARQDFFAFEIPSVGDRREFLDAHGLSRLLGHGAQLVSISPIVRYFVGHDQVVLRVDRRLYVVADYAGAPGLH